MAHPPSRSARASRWARVKRRFSRPQSRTSLAPPRTQGMTPPLAAIRRAAPMSITWSSPSTVADPVPACRSSSDTRTITVAPASGTRSPSHPSTCAQKRDSASAWIIATERRSASGDSASGASRRAANTADTCPRIAVTTGAADSASSCACRCTMPSRSKMRNPRRPRCSSARGPTPSGSSHASARRTSLRTASSSSPSAAAVSTRSASAMRSTPAATRQRSRRATRRPIAGAPSTPDASASRRSGYRAGSGAPSRSLRGAVASPTFTRRCASPSRCPSSRR